MLSSVRGFCSSSHARSAPGGHARWTRSTLIQPIKEFQKGKKQEQEQADPRLSTGLAHKLLVDYGIIRGVDQGHGLYNYLPLAVRYTGLVVGIYETNNLAILTFK